MEKLRGFALGIYVLWLLILVPLVAQETTKEEATKAEPLRPDERYFNTPDDMIPYRTQKPYVRFFLDSWNTGLEYTGPGRAYPEPENLDSVKIGYVGPLYRVVPQEEGDQMPAQYFEIGQYMLHGAQLAIEEANARGGFRKRLPFELVRRNDPVVQTDFGWIWASFSSSVVDLCYDEHVWALFGTIGGENSHILIRIALKAELPVMNSADTDPTFPETRIPWLFRVISDDRMQCYVLAKYAFETLGLKRIAAMRYNGRYGRVGVKEFREASRRLKRPLMIELKFNNGEVDFQKRLAYLQRMEPDAVFLWGNALECARILLQMREMGMNQTVLCSDRVIHPTFLQVAGAAAEGVVAACPWDPTREDPELEAFRKRYRERFDGEEPETYASHAYDGMKMLIEAIEESGLNRARIRDALAERQNRIFKGVTGEIPLNDIYTDAGPITLAVVENGAWVYRREEEMGIHLPRVVKKQTEAEE